MIWALQLAPPSVVAITAAPLGAPPPPTVEPTAQHRVALAQSSAVRELTGAGRPTAVNVPSHGELTPKVEGGAVVAELVQAADGQTPNGHRHHRGPWPRAAVVGSRVHGPGSGIQRTLMTSVCATLS